MLLEQISSDQTAAKDWIHKMYSKYPVNPLVPRQHCIVYGHGEDQELAVFELGVDGPKTVEIKWFQAYPRRSGVGTKAMKELQSSAAKDGITLTLWPWDKGVVSQKNLIAFYKSVGFTQIRRGAKEMIWEPNK